MEPQNPLGGGGGGKVRFKIGTDVTEIESRAREKLKAVVKLVDEMAVPHKEANALAVGSWKALLDGLVADLLPPESSPGQAIGIHEGGGPEPLTGTVAQVAAEEGGKPGLISGEDSEGGCIEKVTSVMLANKRIIVSALKALDEALAMLEGLPVSQNLLASTKDLKKSFQVLHELHVETGDLLLSLCLQMGVDLEALNPPEEEEEQSPEPVIMTSWQTGLGLNALAVPQVVYEEGTEGEWAAGWEVAEGADWPAEANEAGSSTISSTISSTSNEEDNIQIVAVVVLPNGAQPEQDDSDSEVEVGS